MRCACLNGEKKDDQLYYSYLSRLLHPSEGQDRARMDGELVKVRVVVFLLLSQESISLLCGLLQEWCRMSLTKGRPGGIENFLQVASKFKREHMLYRRDVVFLLDISLSRDRRDLFVDLGKPSLGVRIVKNAQLIVCCSFPVDEILGTASYAAHPETMKVVLDNLRKTARQELVTKMNGSALDGPFLRVVLRLFEKMVNVSPDSIDFAQESLDLFTALRDAKGKSFASLDAKFLEILVDEVAPDHALAMMHRWTDGGPVSSAEVLPAIQQVLVKAAKSGVGHELSSTLLRINVSRSEVFGRGSENKQAERRGDIWRRMMNGTLKVNK